MVTSRDWLSGLVAREGASRVVLDVLTPEASLDLLRSVLGDTRLAAEIDAAARLTEVCGRLPLALRIAATHLADHPHRAVDEYRSQLLGGDRLTELRVAGDPDTAVRAAFDVSYRALPPDVRRTFRLLSLVPGPDLSTPTAAAVTGSADIPEHLDVLVGANLLHFTAPGRHGFHDLVRLYAEDLVASDETEQHQLAAIGRLLDEQVRATVAAARFIDPNLGRLPIDVPPSAAPAPADVADAVTWLEAEIDGLLGSLELAARHGFDERAWQLAGALFVFNVRGGTTTERFMTAHCLGLADARRSGNRAAEAAMRNGVSGVHWRAGRYGDALTELTESLRLRTELGDRNGVARTLNNIGAVHDVLGEYAEALAVYADALAAFRDTGDVAGQLGILNNLGLVRRRLGQNLLSLRAFQDGVALADAAGTPHDRGMLLGGLGATETRFGRLTDAVTHLEEAVRLRAESGDQPGAAAALNDLAVAHRAQGRLDEAAARHRTALDLVRTAGDVTTECEMLSDVGETLRLRGHPAQARHEFERALRLAESTGQAYQTGRALDGLARLLADHDPPAARSHWIRARAVFARLGVPEAAEVDARLAAHLSTG